MTKKQMDRLVLEHLKQARRMNAEITNLGWGQGDNFIESKTTKGILTTTMKWKECWHEWTR